MNSAENFVWNPHIEFLQPVTGASLSWDRLLAASVHTASLVTSRHELRAAVESLQLSRGRRRQKSLRTRNCSRRHSTLWTLGGRTATRSQSNSWCTKGTGSSDFLIFFSEFTRADSSNLMICTLMYIWSQTVYWILAASEGWIKQTYRKIMHTQNTQYTLYNIHKITSLEMI